MPNRKAKDLEFEYINKLGPQKKINELESYLQLSLLRIIEEAFISAGRTDFGHFGGKGCCFKDIKRLLIFGIIVPNTSNSPGLVEVKEDVVTIYNLEKVSYCLNVSLDGYVDEILNHEYFRNYHDSEEVILLLKMLAKFDLINQLRSKLQLRALDLIETEEGERALFESLNKYSYTVLLNICERVARYYSDRVIVKQMTREEVEGTALLKVNYFLKRNEKAGYDMFAADPESCGETLRFFVEKILGLPLDILHDVINLNNFKKWSEYEDYKKFEKRYGEEFF